jgi:AP-3 complex subunit delta-1
MQSIVDRLLAHLAPPTTNTALPSAAASLAAVGQTAKGSQSTDPSTTSASITLSPAYRLLIAQKILSVISFDTYVNVSDFEWVVSVLVDVAYVSNVNVGAEVKSLLLDVVGRVRSVRGFAVDVLEKALDDENLIEKSRESGAEAGLVEAAVWICGEYARSVHLRARDSFPTLTVL